MNLSSETFSTAPSPAAAVPSDLRSSTSFSAGRLTNFTTMRYREMGGEYSLDPWSTPITAYGEFSGLNLPARGQAVWNLPSGALPYADLQITSVQYNTPL